MLIEIWLAVSRNGTSGVPRKKSPSNPRTARKTKSSGSDSNSASSSSNTANTTPKDRSPNVKSTQSPISEVHFKFL